MAATPPAAARMPRCGPIPGARPGAIVTVTARRSEASGIIPAEASRGAAPAARVTMTLH
jgi:hypothetical protein